MRNQTIFDISVKPKTFSFCICTVLISARGVRPHLVISCLSNTTSLLIRVMWFCFLLLGFIFFGWGWGGGGGGGCFVVGGRICFCLF